MANANDYVSVGVSLSVPRVPSQVAFGVLMLAAYHTHYTDRFRVYTSSAGMIADGFLATEPAVRLANIYFGGDNPPAQLVVGRRSLPPLQVLSFTLTSASTADTYVGAFVDSAGISHALSVPSTGVPATDATTMRAAITAFTLVGCTVAGTGAIVTLTQTAGHQVDIQGWSTQIMQLAETTADPGIATDLAAIYAANSLGWYGLGLDNNSKAEALAAQAWAEANKKFFFPNTSDFAVAAGTAGNVQLAMKSAGYRKQLEIPYSGVQLLSGLGLGAASYILGQAAGTANLAWQAFPGVVADNDQSLTETQALIINTDTAAVPGVGGQNGNYYRQVAGLNIFWPGCTPSGEWVDQVIGVDVMQAAVQTNVVAYVAGLPKVPLTDFGIGNTADVVATTMSGFATPPGKGTQNALLDGKRGIAITKPTAASLTPLQRQQRNLSGISAAAFFSGAANTVGVQINLSA